MCSSYPGIKLEQAGVSAEIMQNWKFVILCSRRLHNCKTGHFTSWKELERLRNAEKREMHAQSVQNYCFSLSNMQICDILVAVVAVVA